MADTDGLRTVEADVVVVGAGLAGLTAALETTRGGASVAVLEARDRVGGRLERMELGGGVWVDVGGQWIGPTQDRMYRLVRELRLETFPTHATGESLIELDGQVGRYTGTIPDISKPVLLDVLQAQKRLQRMARQVPAEAPWAASKAEEWDSQTAWSWMRRNLATKGGRTLLRLAVKAVWAAEPKDVSLLHLLFYIRSAGDLDKLLDTEGGAQQDRFVEGAQSVPLRLAERLGDSLILSSPVRRIAYTADAVSVIADGAVARASRAIVAIPPTIAGRIAYEPALSGYRDQLTQRVPMGTATKCMAVYERPFWRARGLSGQAVTDAGPLNMIFDNSPPSGSPGILVGFLEGGDARRLGLATAEHRRTEVLHSLGRLFGPEAERPERYIEKAWAEEEWSRGCYVGFTGPGVLSEFGPALREPIGPLHWAGTETASVWNGYMEGAVESGERAAREVLARLGARHGGTTAPAVGAPGA